MTRMFWSVVGLVAVIGVCLVPSLTMGQESEKAAESEKIAPELDKDIRKLMQLNGDIKVGDQLVMQVVNGLRAKLPRVPVDIWQRILKKVDTGGMVDPMVTVYAKHFTHEEIKGLVAFYESPFGKKLVATRPAISADIMKASQPWRIEKVKEIQKIFQAEMKAAQQDQ